MLWPQDSFCSFTMRRVKRSCRCIAPLSHPAQTLDIAARFPFALAPLSLAGVLPEHSRWMTELSSGTSIIAEVRGEDIVPRLRELCGPYCPEIAGHLRPESLRARYGINRVQNAVLCTDLPSDGPLECKYLFCVVDA